MGQCLFRKGTAVVIGNEGNGLPEEVSAACDRRVTIPMHGTIESLNAAMAAGIILWEVQKAAAAVKTAPPKSCAFWGRARPPGSPAGGQYLLFPLPGFSSRRGVLSSPGPR